MRRRPLVERLQNLESFLRSQGRSVAAGDVREAIAVLTGADPTDVKLELCAEEDLD